MTPSIAQPTLPADWRDLVALTKPRVMSLVVFTGLCGLLAAPLTLPPVLGFTAILCIALGAGAAGALNQWYEADLDAKMRRTANRPLPARRMDRQTALHFGVGLAAHGYNKIFGGGKLKGTAGWFGSIGMKWPKWQARLAAATEIGAGLLFAAGS